MRRSLAMIAAAALAVAIAAPAQAANYPNSWNDGFPPASDIGASLGNYKSAPTIDIVKYSDKWFACPEFEARPQAYLATAQYTPTPATQSGMEAQARVYSSPAKAKAAFAGIRANMSKCDGSRVEESEPGSGFKWREAVTTGEVANLMSDGQSSLSVYYRQTPAKGSTVGQSALVSRYVVMTLSGDTILVTSAMVQGKSKVSAKQQSDTVSFAKDFLGTWDKANS